MTKTRTVLSISLGSSKRDHETTLVVGDVTVVLRRMGTDGDVERALALYRQYDGAVDAFGVGGTDLFLEVGRRRYPLQDGLRIRRVVQRSKIADGNGIRSGLERRVVARLAARGVRLKGMPAFVTSGTDRWWLAEALVEAGCDAVFGDLMVVLGLPLPMRSLSALERVARVVAPVVLRLPTSMFYPTGTQQQKAPRPSRVLAPHLARARIIAGDFNQIARNLPADLHCKMILTNTTTADDVAELARRGLALLATCTPRLGGRTFGTNVVEAMLLALIDRPQEAISPADLEREMDRVGLEPAFEILDPEAMARSGWA